jgi:hypothetical protein
MQMHQRWIGFEVDGSQQALTSPNKPWRDTSLTRHAKA